MQTNTPPVSDSAHSKDTPKKWYREFWAWFILTPLIVVVIVSSITVSLAVRNADDRVIDNYYKEGRMINMRLEEDLKAAELQLVAEIDFDQSLAELVVRLNSIEQQFPSELILDFSHVSDQTLDHQVLLKHIHQGHYQAELDRVLAHRWYLRLSPKLANSDTVQVPQNEWRLRGDINFSQSSSVRLAAEL